MKQKIKKIVYALSQNSRITTKELGKQLKTSQQSASYLIASLKKKKTLQDFTTIIDPAKFGYINVLVYYHFSEFSFKSTQEITTYLQQLDDVVKIEHLEDGFDLACIFCVPNLSYFNKINRDFLQKFKKRIFIAEMFPLVVKHLYLRSYLLPRKYPSEKIICGDRDIIKLSEREKKVLTFLYDHPTTSIIEISRKLSLNPKTVISIKQRLEKSKIIRGYSSLWNYSSLSLSHEKILFDSSELNLTEDRRLLEFSKIHPNIISLTRLFGKHDVLIDVEGEELTKRDVLKELRSEFNIRDYRVVRSKQIIKDKYVSKSALG